MDLRDKALEVLLEIAEDKDEETSIRLKAAETLVWAFPQEDKNA